MNMRIGQNKSQFIIYSLFTTILVSCTITGTTNVRQLKLKNDLTEVPNLILKPNKKSSEYIYLKESHLNINKLFNSETRDTKSIIIKGIDITLDAASNDYNNLYEKIVGSNSEPRGDLEQLIIHCETLNIIGKLNFPQTDIYINAKRLNFIDTDKQTSQIITTPKPFSKRAEDATIGTNAQNGMDGMKAGNVTLNIKEILFNSKNTDTRNEIRLILTGGKGQNAGEGLPGNPGRDIPTYNIVKNGYDKVIWNVCDRYKSVPCENVIFIGNVKIGSWALQGSTIWPGDGENAKSAGIPGSGGNGGTLTIGQELIDSTKFDISGGVSSEKSKDQIGGRGGFPNPAYKICHNGPGSIAVCRDGKHETKKGVDALAPAPKVDLGLVGEISARNNKQWLTVELVDILDQYANDLYRSGYYTDSKVAFNEIYEDLKDHEKIRSNYTTNWPLHKTSILNSIIKNINQIDNQIDFYENQKNWVPTLSLELMLESYKNQINSTFNELFLYHQILNRAESNAGKKINLKIQALKELEKLNSLNGELSSNITELKELDKLVTPIRDSIKTYQNLINYESNRLLIVANNNTQDRVKAQSLISTLKKLSEYAKIASLTFTAGKTLGDINIIKTLEELHTNLNGVNEEYEWQESQETIIKLNNLSQKIDNISQIVDNLQYKSIYISADVLKEFENLRKESKYYNELVEKIKNLINNSEKINSKLTKKIIRVQDLNSQVATSLHNKSIIENKNITTVRYTDNDLITTVEKLKKRTENKLLKYQYYLLRSFQYEFVKTYPTSFSLNNTYKEFQRIISSNPNNSEEWIDLQPANFASLKTIYKQDIDKVIDGGLIDLINRGTRNTSFIEFDLSKNEINELKIGNTVNFNLGEKGLISAGERMQKIIAIKINQLKIRKKDFLGTIKFTIRHSGNSLLLKKNEMYYFQHGIIPNLAFQWTYSYSAKSNNVHIPSNNITDSSLLKSLLYIDGSEEKINNLRQYSLPGLLSNYQIEMTSLPTSKIDLQNLTIQIEYEYENEQNQ